MAGEEGESWIGVAILGDVVIHLFGELIVWLTKVGLRSVDKVGVGCTTGGGEVGGTDGKHGPGHCWPIG